MTLKNDQHYTRIVPEKRLLAAIAGRAIRDIEEHLQTEPDALEWLMRSSYSEEDLDSSFPFEYVCQELGLNSKDIRKELIDRWSSGKKVQRKNRKF